MRERSEQVLRIACFVLGVLLLVQVVRLVLNLNPLGHLRIPALPTLSIAAETSPAGKGTNTVPALDTLKKVTNALARDSASSNSPAVRQLEKPATNLMAEAEARAGGTNALSERATNSVAEREARHGKTNLPAAQLIEKIGTNQAAALKPSGPGSNSMPRVASSESGSNLVARPGTVKNSTNSGQPFGPAGLAMGPALPPGAMPMGMNPALRRGIANKPPDLPPATMARVDRVTDSEILGPIMHPLPMALLGIAGDAAFLRGPTGQAGMVKEGEDLGPVKLLRIGTNRVLVEQDGQKKELMIFSGFGGEPMLQQDHP